jgi:hypothetical protein
MRLDAVPLSLGEQLACDPADVVTQSRLPFRSYQYLAVAPPMVASVTWLPVYRRLVVWPFFTSLVTLPARMVLSPSSFTGSSKV